MLPKSILTLSGCAFRGITISHGTAWRWAGKFGRDFPIQIRRQAPQLGDIWHLDEVVISINGQQHGLWRAADRKGHVPDALLQSHRDTGAALRLLRKLIRKQARVPQVLVTDRPGSCGTACKALKMGFERRQRKGLNNRAENSHQPARRRERIMKRFKSARHLQRFVSIHDPIANLFHFPRNSMNATGHRSLRTEAMSAWAHPAAVAA